MNLSEIYRPIKSELNRVEEQLHDSLLKTRNKKILTINRYLLDSPGKRIRPALVILCAKATEKNPSKSKSINLTKIAAAIELIHMASLLHDDVIDKSDLRCNKSTINSKWGTAAAIALGDYIYSEAFSLIAKYGNTDILQCITQAAMTMCEGEFTQVCERDNLQLAKDNYMLIIKKKTASLFAASCHVGGLSSNVNPLIQKALKNYGTNYGIAFQITDDYFDLAGNKSYLGKNPGQDIREGELTLPILYLMDSIPKNKHEELNTILKSKFCKNKFLNIKNLLSKMMVKNKIQKTVISIINTAKNSIKNLPNSIYKENLLYLADYSPNKLSRITT